LHVPEFLDVLLEAAVHVVVVQDDQVEVVGEGVRREERDQEQKERGHGEVCEVRDRSYWRL
jgi:hypothetical protein